MIWRIGVQFFDSEDDVNDNDFVYDRNVEDRIAVGLNSDPVVEERHADAIREDSDSDHSYDPTTKDLNTDYSSDKESNARYPTFNEENEMWDPQFEVGKTFIVVLHFRKAIRNHGVATRCNLRMKTNDDKRAQEWYGDDVVQLQTDVASQNANQCQADVTKGKLQPRRSRQSAANVTSEPSPSEFHFMPTPRIVSRNHNMCNAVGPPLVAVGSEILSQGFSVDNMVDDLQQMEKNEQARMKSKRAKNKRIARK
ncbi:Uncharacterized protein Adt_06540 [Abeliophyllum distichum]|uniref:Uncharacterized protein n=1 Tax=Abeliophyllum distichum TaxID=126358 RepID=A0ABD1V781_9LAMI